MSNIIFKLTILFIGVTLLTIYSCKRKEIPPEYSKAQFNFKVMAGTSTLLWDTIKYTTSEGINFGVSTINMFVSNITLTRSEGSHYSSKKIFYVDPSYSAKSFFKLDSIPPGYYTQISFYIGIDSTKNKTFGLPSSTENLNMTWPDLLGGGYHFLKFEGNYFDAINAKIGYAIHLGNNINLPSVKLNCEMKQKYWNHSYSLYFNVNALFDGPYIYSFNLDNNYTMTDSAAMQKIKNNMSHAFSIKQDN